MKVYHAIGALVYESKGNFVQGQLKVMMGQQTAGIHLLSVILSGAIIEQKQWVFELDFTRLITLSLFLLSYVEYELQFFALFFITIMFFLALWY